MFIQNKVLTGSSNLVQICDDDNHEDAETVVDGLSLWLHCPGGPGYEEQTGQLF